MPETQMKTAVSNPTQPNPHSTQSIHTNKTKGNQLGTYLAVNLSLTNTNNGNMQRTKVTYSTFK
ncbi:uncharacterized protein MEPE_03260 [Melanopsichium pennsylvanicum]|uniref:Uncharacterized protein n=1 Tax=Melanopsichium pennsylvanicum TaxID=63383 RepID=A0AAJ4XMK8_9BASI|nr:uncharacterized protein MEPE_03260 [Melanopsichium pennsylvanicum]